MTKPNPVARPSTAVLQLSSNNCCFQQKMFEQRMPEPPVYVPRRKKVVVSNITSDVYLFVHSNCKKEGSAPPPQTREGSALLHLRHCTALLEDRTCRATYTFWAVRKKSLSKHINIRSYFEDLDATNSFLKTDRDLKSWFTNILSFCLRIKKRKRKSTHETTHTAIEVGSVSLWPTRGD